MGDLRKQRRILMEPIIRNKNLWEEIKIFRINLIKLITIKTVNLQWLNSIINNKLKKEKLTKILTLPSQ